MLAQRPRALKRAAAPIAGMLDFSAHRNAAMNLNTFDRELDVRGLNCPLPILRAKKALGDLSAGQVLKVVATDPGSVKDFEAFCKQTGNELLSHSQGPEFTFFMKKR
jgi:tRNA 2-thiouridine synthesizing protein A